MSSIKTAAAVLLVTGVSVFAQAQAQTAPVTLPKDTTAASATQIIQHFARASDKRDVQTLDALLHPAFRVVFNVKPGSQPSVLDRTQYIQMARDGKIGGLERSVVVANVSLTNGFATGTSRMEHEKAAFESIFSLIQVNGQWMLLQEAVLMAAK
jgi:Putative lumazine-binding